MPSDFHQIKQLLLYGPFLTKHLKTSLAPFSLYFKTTNKKIWPAPADFGRATEEFFIFLSSFGFRFGKYVKY